MREHKLTQELVPATQRSIHFCQVSQAYLLLSCSMDWATSFRKEARKSCSCGTAGCLTEADPFPPPEVSWEPVAQGAASSSPQWEGRECSSTYISRLYKALKYTQVATSFESNEIFFLPLSSFKRQSCTGLHFLFCVLFRFLFTESLSA